MPGMRVQMREFGAGCPKCKTPAGIRSYCDGCKHTRAVEHMHCSCTSCGYAWVEKPADATKVKPQKGGKR